MINPRFKSLMLVLLRETHIIVTVATAIGILYLRSVHSLWFGVGTLVATGTAKLLKRCIRQPRPTESSKQHTYGMPSTHSSSISFFGAYLLLVCLRVPLHGSLGPLVPGEPSWQGRREGDDWLGALGRVVAGLCVVGAAGAVCWSRVRLGHHTPTQVVAGATVGATIGWLWFALWAGFVLPVPGTSQRVAIAGFGPQVEAETKQTLRLLAEAWQMRDGGLVWDGVLRPMLNGVTDKVGLGKPFRNGLPADTEFAPLRHVDHQAFHHHHVTQ